LTDLPTVPRSLIDAGDFDLSGNIAYLLVRAKNTLSQYVEQGASHMGLTHAQACCLMMLANGHSTTPTELSRRLDIDAGAVTRLVDRMERRGLIARSRGEADRRMVHLTLTDDGHAIVQRLPSVFIDVTHRGFAGFSPEEIAMFRQMLIRVVANGGVAD